MVATIFPVSIPEGSWLERLMRAASSLGVGVALMVAGLIVSALARRLVKAMVRGSGVEALAERAGVARALYAVGIKDGLASFLGGVVYATGLVLTLSVVSDALGLSIVSTLMASLLRYLPRLLTAVAFLLGTTLVASVVRSFIEHLAAQRGDIESPRTAAALAHGSVMLLGGMLAAEQAGIEISLLSTLLQIALGGAVLGLALSFALGFHGVFRGMVARHYYAPLVRVGDVVRVGEDEGTVVSFAPSALVLRTADGERIIPCTRLLHHTVHIRSSGSPMP